MEFWGYNLSKEELTSLYNQILLPRMIEEKMLVLLRQGKISKWFSGIGQEAIAVGVTAALHQDEYILPLHRNLGVFTTRKMPFEKLFLQWQGKKEGYSKGRERSFHFGSNEHHIVGMISHLGPQLCLADGISLAYKLQQQKKVSAVFTGDGGTSEGDFHEALNIASVWKLPVLFIIENNGYGLSTPINEQFACAQLADRALGYGMESVILDGNNILEVYTKIKQLAEDIRENPRPVLVECMTFRMRGHEEASGVKYVPKELLEMWAKKDPVTNYQEYLLNDSIITKEAIEQVKKKISSEIEDGLQEAFLIEDPHASSTEELVDVFMPFQQKIVLPTSQSQSKRMIDAISDGLRLAMEKHDNLVLMGQDIAAYGGVFKITEGFIDQFGKDRVRNTPICESGVLSAALGLSVMKMKAMVEMQFADFVSTGFNPIVNNLAKSYYRWGQNADVVVRMPTGAGVGAGPFHSQSNEAWFFHVPGIKIFYPSNPYDAKGLLLTAFEDPNPVMFFEHKKLYRSVEAEVPDGYYTLEAGKANLIAEGEDLSIITYGMGVHWAKSACETLNVSADIVDLRTLVPLDIDSVLESVKKCGKALVLHEDNLTGGIGAEIVALINEKAFEYLDAPVKRVASLDTPIPFALTLEENYLANQRLNESILSLLAY